MIVPADIAQAPLDRILESIAADDLVRDPYPFLQRLRAESPVAYVPALGCWFVTRFDDVRAVLRKPAQFGMPQVAAEVFTTVGSRGITNTDDPGEHRHLRKGLVDAFARPAVESHLAPAVARIVEDLLDELEAKEGTADLVGDFCELLSMRALKMAVGIAEIPDETTGRWFKGLTVGVSLSAGEGDAAGRDYALTVAREIDDELSTRMRRVIDEPDGSVLSHMMANARGATADEKISEVMPTMKIAIGGGQQEPGHGAATVLAAVLDDPVVRDRVISATSPDDIAGLVTEGLRWVSPIQIVARQVVDDIELGGTVLPAGATVFTSLASANRDEEIFGSDSATFDAQRPAERDVVFGMGLHSCVGAFFGPMVIRTGVFGLFRRFPGLRLAPGEEITFSGMHFRSPVRLSVTW